MCFFVLCISLNKNILYLNQSKSWWPQWASRRSLCYALFQSYKCHCFVHYDVTQWKHIPRYWPFVTGGFPSQGACSTEDFDVFFDVSLNKKWTNSRVAGSLRRHDAHCDVNVIVNLLPLFAIWIYFIAMYDNKFVLNLRIWIWINYSCDR